MDLVLVQHILDSSVLALHFYEPARHREAGAKGDPEYGQLSLRLLRYDNCRHRHRPRQVVNAAFLNLFWIFFLGIAFQLCGGTLQFVRMILLPPHESEPDRR